MWTAEFGLVIFFFNDTATTEIYTLSLHDALPISASRWLAIWDWCRWRSPAETGGGDRKSTRLNSSHVEISYAVFCLKKKTKTPHPVVTTQLRFYVLSRGIFGSPLNLLRVVACTPF